MSTVTIAVIMAISFFFLFIYVGGNEHAYDQLNKLITPNVKVQFEGFKKTFHKNYTNATEEEKRLTIFAQNLREIYKREKLNFEDWYDDDFDDEIDPDELDIWIANQEASLTESYTVGCS